MKYKIEFSGKAELMFAMMAKLLPDELNVHVEELPDTKEDHFSKVAQLVSSHQKLVAPPKENKIQHFKHPSGKSLHDLMILFMQHNPKIMEWRELSNHAVELGFHKSSINNAITRLITKKIIEKTAPGMYRLIKKSHEK